MNHDVEIMSTAVTCLCSQHCIPRQLSRPLHPLHPLHHRRRLRTSASSASLLNQSASSLHRSRPAPISQAILELPQRSTDRSMPGALVSAAGVRATSDDANDLPIRSRDDSQATVSVSRTDAARGTTVTIAIPLDDGAAGDHGLTPPRRKAPAPDGFERREALLKGREGSRRRQRWENGESGIFSYLIPHTPIIHHTSYIIPHTSYLMPHAACFMPHTSYIMHHTSCSKRAPFLRLYDA